MKFLIFLTLACFCHCGVIDHHERAHSYQNIHIEHFHPVPTYIKKEHSHLLEHPISLGTSSSKIEVHHGDKHDHGYAIASAENNIHGHGFEDFNEGLTGGHEVGVEAAYQVHDQGEEGQYQGHAGAALEQFHLTSGVQGLEGGHVYDSQ